MSFAIEGSTKPGAATFELRVEPTDGRTWHYALSTNEPKYGGEQPGLWDPVEKEFVLAEPEVIVFSEGEPS